MDNKDLEYWVQVMQNMLSIARQLVDPAKGRNEANWLYFIENEVIPSSKALRDQMRADLGWDPLP